MWIPSGRATPPMKSLLPMNSATKRVCEPWNTSSGPPICSTFPHWKTASRSPMNSASSWSCVTNMAVARMDLQNPSHLFPHLDAQVCVQAAERLIQQQHLGLRRQRARQCRPLALAARKRMRVAPCQRFQPHQFQVFVYCRPVFVLSPGRANQTPRCRIRSGVGTMRAPGRPSPLLASPEV